MGPMTGRGAGFCAGFESPGFATPGAGQGMGRGGTGLGLRRGVCGVGRGAGRGLGRGFFAGNPMEAPVTPVSRKSALQDQLSALQAHADIIAKQLKQLESDDAE